MSVSNLFIGRQTAVATLEEAHARALEGRGSFILVSGEEGAGKTSLLNHFVDSTRMRLLLGRAHPHSHAPFQTLASALRTDPNRISAGLENLLPPHPSPEDRMKAPHEGDLEKHEQRFIDYLTCLVEKEPLCLILEDLHFAENATCEFLPRLAEALLHLPILILGVYRSEEVGGDHPLRKLRHELRRRGLYREVEVGALSKAEARELAAHWLGAPPVPSLASLLYEKTRGLPLFLQEYCELLLARDLVVITDQGVELARGKNVPIPEGVRDPLLARLGTLSCEARELIEAASVLGSSFDFEVLLGVVNASEALEELLASGLIFERSPGQGRFRHDLLRDVVLEEMPWTRRRKRHREFAEILESRGAPADVVAFHHLQSGNREKARSLFNRAGEEAFRVSALSDAVYLFEESLKLWPPGSHSAERLSVLFKLAQASQLTGDLEKSLSVWREILEPGQEDFGREREAEALRGIATVLTLQGFPDQAIPYRQKAAAIFLEIGEPGRAALEWLETSDILAMRGRYGVALENASRAEEASVAAMNSDLLAASLAQKAFMLATQGKTELALEHLKQAYEKALCSKSPEVLSAVYRRAAYVHEYVGDMPQSLDAFKRALDICESNSKTEERTVCLGCMSHVVMKVGDWKEAARICRGIFKDPKAPVMPKAVGSGILGLICVFRGEVKKARSLLSDCEHYSHQIGLESMTFLSEWGYALLEEAEGREDLAVRRYLGILDYWKKSEDRLDVVFSLYTAAKLFARLGKRPELDRCAATLGEVVCHSSNPEPLAALNYVSGEIALVNGVVEEGIDHLESALVRLRQLQFPLESAWTAHRLGEARLQSMRDENRGVECLHQALKIFKKLGARPCAASVAETLKSHGFATLEKRVPTEILDLDGSTLTRRQKEVAALISRGLTNKEIAEHLFISPRTVDMHVAHLLSRLDCRTRSEATRKLADLGVL